MKKSRAKSASKKTSQGGRAPKLKAPKKTAQEKNADILAAIRARRAHAGRPSAYEARFAEEVIAFMSAGYSLTAFAGAIGVSRDTVYEWEKVHPEFSDAIKRARTMRVTALEDRLLFGLPETTTATIFALKNACPDEWRKEPAVEFTVNNAGAVNLNKPLEEWGEAEIRAELARRGALATVVSPASPKHPATATTQPKAPAKK